MRARSPFYRWPWKEKVEQEVDEELAFHLEMRTREYIARGMTRDEARREAERRLGNIDAMRDSLRALGRGRDRHMKRAQYVGELRQDVTFTGRQLLKNPGFAAIAIFTLAIGIGGTTAIFSAVHAVVLKPLPLPDLHRLTVVDEMYRGVPNGAMSVGNYWDAANGAPAFEAIAAVQFFSFNLSDGTTPERIPGARVTANYFSVLGMAPSIGRVFTAAEDTPGNDGVVVLSHSLWRRRFGGRSDVVGRTVRMSGRPYAIVGVMPAAFELTNGNEELWTPIAFTAAQKALHDEHYLIVYGRLKPGASRGEAQTQLDAVAARLRRENPQDAGTLYYTILDFQQQFVGDYRNRLFVLLGAVVIVLLIACANVSNLLLARGAVRGRELAVRSALGAGRARIIRQLLTESAMLAVVAAAAGVAVAPAIVRALIAWAPAGVPRIEQARVDLTSLAFATMATMVTTILSGLAPAIQLARGDIQMRLRSGGRGATAGGRRDRLRAALVAAEVALSILLLVGAGLLIRSALAMQRVDPGFDPTNVLTARVMLPQSVYAEPARVIETFTRLREEAAAIPGATSAAVTSFAALGPGGGSNGLLPEGMPFALGNLITSQLRIITPEFFAAMRVPIVQGRNFDVGDRRGGQKVMIISKALAERSFPGQNPVGKRISCCENTDGRGDFKVVVGVAGDIRSRSLARAPRPEFYLPLSQAPTVAWDWIQRTMYVVVRTNGDPTSLVEPLRSAMLRIDPDLPLFNIRLMDQRIALSMATARFNTLLLALLGGIGLALAAVGIYGVVAYLVSQRTQEIGVRVALGATRANVIGLVLRQAMRPVAVGATLGLVLARAASRVLTSQLFDVKPTDPLTIAVVSATLIAVALAASAVPARRAATVDPTRALQTE